MMVNSRRGTAIGVRRAVICRGHVHTLHTCGISWYKRPVQLILCQSHSAQYTSSAKKQTSANCISFHHPLFSTLTCQIDRIAQPSPVGHSSQRTRSISPHKVLLLKTLMELRSDESPHVRSPKRAETLSEVEPNEVALVVEVDGRDGLRRTGYRYVAHSPG